MSSKAFQISIDEINTSADDGMFEISEVPMKEDIAIIGISVKFPKANDIDEFWHNCSNGIDCVSDLQEARKMDADKYLNYVGMKSQNTKYIRGSFIDEIDKFDHKLFRLAPREASLMNPVQRLFLERVWDLTENAGYGGDRLRGSKTGVFVGYIADLEGYKYKQIITEIENSFDSMAVTGNLSSMIPSRISYLLDLKGPTMLVDTACSSSLVAVHMACESIRNGTCDMAIAGAAKINLLPLETSENIGIESSDGRTRTFDDNSDGTGFGEGIVAVLLKPLRKAQKDGDNIYAVVKGGAINQDGSSAGITAPNANAQSAVIIKAWQDACIDPETISYIEAHGTGTKLGDPIEIDGIRKAFRKFTEKNQFCAIGSVKTNIGHLFDAAGLAGLVKAALSLKYKQIPPSINFNRPNRIINFEESPVFVNDILRKWETKGFPRRCGISSFGFSGTNCHIILEEAPELPRVQKEEHKLSIMTLSAKSDEALKELVLKYSKYLDNCDAGIRDICYTANTGRNHYDYRVAIVLRDKNDLRRAINEIKDSVLQDSKVDNVFYGRHKIVVVDNETANSGELTESEKAELNKMADALINSNDEYSLDELCKLYVWGADVTWKELYRKEKRIIVTLPTYPFEKTRCWIEIPEIAGIDNKTKVRRASNLSDKYFAEVKLLGRNNDEYSDHERRLGQIWANVLGFKEINIHDNFFELGGDSISLMKIITGIRSEFEVDISFNKFVDGSTISKIGELILNSESGMSAEKYCQSVPDPEKQHVPFPLTDVQLAYLMGRDTKFELGGVATHVYFEFKTMLDIGKLNDSLRKVIGRHPMLRAIFLSDGSQKILEEVPEYKIEVADISFLNVEEQQNYIIAERNKSSHYVFDPGHWPLFEYRACKLSEGVHHLFVHFDMLIADGTSLMIIGKELMQHYDDPDLELPRLDFTFRDYMMAYSKFKESVTYKKDKEYWLSKVKDFPPTPALPLKMNPEDVDKPHFKRYQKVFEGQKWNEIKKAAQIHNVSLSSVLCTAYAEVLAFWSNQYRLAVNLTVFNRYPFHNEIDKIIGDFTSVMLLGIELQPNISFWEKAAYVQRIMMEALEHRHYDGIEFIREVTKANSLGNKAAMPVVFTSMLFNSDNNFDNWYRLGDLEMSLSQTPQVYLDNQAIEMNGGLSVTWDFVEQLFEESVIDTMFNQYTNIISQLVDSNKEYKLQPTDQDIALIEQYNSTFEEIPITTLHELFINQVKRTPDNIAVEFEGETLTYEELHRKSNQVAHYLSQHEIGRNDLVAVLAERCETTIINLIGILKVGAAYLPVDPDHPQERKEYIVKNSQCKLMLDPDWYRSENINEYPVEDMNVRNVDDVAYVIYTSGSTGSPKGVVITHKAAANTVIDINHKFNVNESDRILGISSLCFDLSVYDIFGALSTGATLVMIPDQRDVRNLIDAVENKNITIWNSVPAIMDMLVDNLNVDANKVNEFATTTDDLTALPSVKKEHNDEVVDFYWSPVVHWERGVDGIIIGSCFYSDTISKMFPEFYFIAQKGTTLGEVLRAFPGIDGEEVRCFIHDLLINKILVPSILNPDELFYSQQRLFKNEYSEEIISDSDKLEKFKSMQLNRRHVSSSTDKIKLLCKENYPVAITNRKTCRVFEEYEKVPFEKLAELLSVFRQIRVGSDIKYYYASAGGLYPIDVFLYIKEGRVEGMKKGLYYYSPIDNSICRISDSADIGEDCHYFTNKSIFKSSAFSIFLVYNAEANMPKYGGRGYLYACLDAGIMVSTITYAAELLDIGICSIGDMSFKKIEKYFSLNNNQVFLHTIEGGLKNESK